MKPISVALVHRNSPRCMDSRAIGAWSYPVPEFTWLHYPVNKNFRLNIAELAGNGHQVIVYEDAKIFGTFVGPPRIPVAYHVVDSRDATIPVAYHVVDSTHSDAHYRHRYKEAEKWADIVLLDWDAKARFNFPGKFTARFNYCINEQLYRDYGLPKDIDVGAFLGRSPERRAVQEHVAQFCKERGYTFRAGVIRGREEYARLMNRSKIVLNPGRRPGLIREHRVFDVMGVRSCLLTSPLHPVPGEVREPGIHYIQRDFSDYQGIERAIEDLLADNAWEEIANEGHKMVHQRHTWAVRARELRQILEQTVLREVT